MHIAIGGAGALGAAAALHLTRAGHEVTLIERTQVAGATTGLAAGLLTLGVQEPVERRIVRATIQGIEQTAHALDEPSPLRRPGSTAIARSRHEAAHLDALSQDLQRLDEPHEPLTPEEWGDAMEQRGLEAKSDDLVQALSIPGDAWALSTDTTNLMIRAARRAGLSLRQNTGIERIRWGNSPRTATGLHLEDGERLDADHVVLAMGAWTAPFLREHGLRLPALAFTTHAAVLALENPVDPPILHDHPGHYYLRPESDTHLLIGNGTNTTPTDPATFHPTADGDFSTSVARRLTQRFPALRHARFQNAWRGILSATPDRGALAGAHPDAQHLWVLTGDNGYGFMRSHALGHLLATRIDPGIEPISGIPPQAYERTDPARFWPHPPERFPVHEGFELTDEDTPGPA